MRREHEPFAEKERGLELRLGLILICHLDEEVATEEATRIARAILRLHIDGLDRILRSRRWWQRRIRAARRWWGLAPWGSGQ